MVAGWAVDDNAGRVFAKVFYQGMLDGMPFGDAVRTARMSVYRSSETANNTWAAYQCYGDPGFQLAPPQVGGGSGSPAKAGYQYTPVLSDKPDATEFPLAAQWADWQTKYSNYTIQDQAFPKELADGYFQIQSEITQGKQTPQQAAENMQKAVEQSGGS